MTPEERELLLQDLCGRLKYGVKCQGVTTNVGINTIKGYSEAIGTYDFFIEEIDGWFSINMIKPYLRPLSSMTPEEMDIFRSLGGVMSYSPQHDTWALCAFSPEAYDYLNANYFDYRGLIHRKLAIEVTQENNPYKSKQNKHD